MNNTAIQPTLQWYRRKHWLEQFGGDVFATDGSLEWFLRQHKPELIARGAVISRMGPGGLLLHETFGQIAMEILQRDSERQQLEVRHD